MQRWISGTAAVLLFAILTGKLPVPREALLKRGASWGRGQFLPEG